MAATVTNIITAIKAAAAAELGATYQELMYVFDVSQNAERLGQKAYGVRALGATSRPAPLRTYEFDHTFELILVDTNPKSSDADATTVIGTHFNKLDEIYKDMAAGTLSVSGVLMVSEPSFSEPELINGTALVALRMQFNVRYRHSV